MVNYVSQWMHNQVSEQPSPPLSRSLPGIQHQGVPFSSLSLSTVYCGKSPLLTAHGIPWVVSLDAGAVFGGLMMLTVAPHSPVLNVEC